MDIALQRKKNRELHKKAKNWIVSAVQKQGQAAGLEVKGWNELFKMTISRNK